MLGRLMSALLLLFEQSWMVSSSHGEPHSPLLTGIFAMRELTNPRTKLFDELYRDIYQFGDSLQFYNNSLNDEQKDRLGLKWFFEKTNYFTQIETNSTAKHHCQWIGVDCCRQGRVKEIAFYSGNISGTFNVNQIMKKCNYLDKLETIELCYNQNNDFYFNGFPSNMESFTINNVVIEEHKLTSLSQFLNEDEFAKLNALRKVDFGGNNLQRLPWDKLPNDLTYLDLNHNALSYGFAKDETKLDWAQLFSATRNKRLRSVNLQFNGFGIRSSHRIADLNLLTLVQGFFSEEKWGDSEFRLEIFQGLGWNSDFTRHWNGHLFDAIMQNMTLSISFPKGSLQYHSDRAHLYKGHPLYRSMEIICYVH